MSTKPRISKTEAEWRAQLTPMQYHVAREKGTEHAFSGEYWDCKDPGTYRCIGCGEPLFDSTAKFDSGCGWPSFTVPVAANRCVSPSHFPTLKQLEYGTVRGRLASGFGWRVGSGRLAGMLTCQ